MLEERVNKIKKLKDKINQEKVKRSNKPIKIDTTIAGALMSTVRVTAKTTRTFQPAEKNLKLAYLSDARKNGLL